MMIFDKNGLTFEGTEEDCKRLIATKGYSSRPPLPGAVIAEEPATEKPAKGKK